jgi:hypothetical protein
MLQLCWIRASARFLSSSKGTYSSEFSWVAGGLREVRHQHRAPPSSAWRPGTSDCRPGKPISGTGVLRSFPVGFAEGKELFRDFDADHVGSGVLGAGLAAAGGWNPVIGRMEHESSFSPRTFRSSGMTSPIVHYIVPVAGVLAAGKRLR